jgi:hypothetical protein
MLQPAGPIPRKVTAFREVLLAALSGPNAVNLGR